MYSKVFFIQQTGQIVEDQRYKMIKFFYKSSTKMGWKN